MTFTEFLDAFDGRSVNTARTIEDVYKAKLFLQRIKKAHPFDLPFLIAYTAIGMALREEYEKQEKKELKNMRYRAIVVHAGSNSPVIGEDGRPIQIIGNNFETVKNAAMIVLESIVLESHPNAVVAIYESIEVLKETVCPDAKH